MPLEAERGYHVMFANPGFELQRALVSADRNVSLAHMIEGIRATGIAEFAAPDAPPNMRQCAGWCSARRRRWSRA